MTSCYVCNASAYDPCLAIDGEFAECPRPIRPTAVLREACVFPSCPPHCNSCPGLSEPSASGQKGKA
jgi:hypothetical protein